MIDPGDLVPAHLIFVPEPVARPQSAELVDQDRPQRLTDAFSPAMILGQRSDPEVDVVDAAILRAKLVLQGDIVRDLAELPHAVQAIRLTHAVVIGQAMIAATGDVEAGEVEAAGTGGAKQEIADAVDDLVVEV